MILRFSQKSIRKTGPAKSTNGHFFEVSSGCGPKRPMAERECKKTSIMILFALIFTLYVRICQFMQRNRAIDSACLSFGIMPKLITILYKQSHYHQRKTFFIKPGMDGTAYNKYLPSTT